MHQGFKMTYHCFAYYGRIFLVLHAHRSCLTWILLWASYRWQRRINTRNNGYSAVTSTLEMNIVNPHSIGYNTWKIFHQFNIDWKPNKIENISSKPKLFPYSICLNVKNVVLFFNIFGLFFDGFLGLKSASKSLNRKPQNHSET